VSVEDSLRQSIEKAKKRYSSLFKLPSDRKILLGLAFVCIVCGLLPTLLVIPSLAGAVDGLLVGLIVFFAGLIADFIIHTLIMTKEAIYNLRRTMAISLFSWGLWFLFILLGTVFAALTGIENWWFRLCLMGFAAVIILRLVVLSSTTTMSRIRVLAGSLLEPFLCVFPFLALWSATGNPLTFYIPLFLVFAVVVGIVSSYSFLYPLDRMGRRLLGIRSLLLFRAFMFNWVLGLNAPFEELLEELGEKKKVEASLLNFVSEKSQTIIVVPSIHPGPFKNIGSSLLPSLLKGALEKEFACTACVPHGLLGHEYDLASQRENQKVIGVIISAVHDSKGSDATASPFVKETNGLATACCQVFGKSAIISFTLAPKTIEDLPEELGLLVHEEAERNGLDLCAIVNAHNSIDGDAEVADAVASLKDIADRCLKKAVALDQLPFEMGAATILPAEFSLEDGMGAGGITVIVIQTGKQRSAYVVVDGNNMVSGLREEILTSLKQIGIDDGEVFTTDTLSVSDLILGDQGYHPVGEAMDRGRLIAYVDQATSAATARLEPVQGSCRSITVNDVTVLGEKQLETLCLLIDKSLRTAKRIAVPIFLVAGLALMSFLLFL